MEEEEEDRVQGSVLNQDNRDNATGYQGETVNVNDHRKMSDYGLTATDKGIGLMATNMKVKLYNEGLQGNFVQCEDGQLLTKRELVNQLQNIKSVMATLGTCLPSSRQDGNTRVLNIMDIAKKLRAVIDIWQRDEMNDNVIGSAYRSDAGTFIVDIVVFKLRAMVFVNIKYPTNYGRWWQPVPYEGDFENTTRVRWMGYDKIVSLDLQTVNRYPGVISRIFWLFPYFKCKGESQTYMKIRMVDGHICIIKVDDNAKELTRILMWYVYRVGEQVSPNFTHQQ